MRKILILSILIISTTIPIFSQIDLMAPARQNVEITSADGTRIGAQLTTPRGNGPHPAVLLIPEWWGLNNEIYMLSEGFINKGYTVLIVDPFRGSVASTAAEARRQVTATPQNQIAEDIDASLAFLASRYDVDETSIAVVGFCFGGTQAMRMAARNEDVAATVIFYGSGPFQNPDELGIMAENGPILGIYGENDSNIPISQVQQFEKILNDAGVENTIEIYPGVGHAFVKSDTYNQGGAAQQAWQQMIAFLDEEL